jgi:hypothetical protein
MNLITQRSVVQIHPPQPNAFIRLRAIGHLQRLSKTVR